MVEGRRAGGRSYTITSRIEYSPSSYSGNVSRFTTMANHHLSSFGRLQGGRAKVGAPGYGSAPSIQKKVQAGMSGWAPPPHTHDEGQAAAVARARARHGPMPGMHAVCVGCVVGVAVSSPLLFTTEPPPGGQA